MSSKTSAVRPFLAAFAMATASCIGISSAFASGSMTPGGGQGADAYSVGKSLFFKEVACGTCAYSGRGKDAADAKSLLTSLKAADSKVKLGADDMEAVNTYLTKRFRLAEMAGK